MELLKKETVKYGKESIKCPFCGLDIAEKLNPSSNDKVYKCIRGHIFDMEALKEKTYEAFSPQDYMQYAKNSLKINDLSSAIKYVHDAFVASKTPNDEIIFYYYMLSMEKNSSKEAADKLVEYFRRHPNIEQYEKEYLSYDIANKGDRYFVINFNGYGFYGKFIDKNRCDYYLSLGKDVSKTYISNTGYNKNWFHDYNIFYFDRDAKAYKYMSYSQIDYMFRNNCVSNFNPDAKCFGDVTLRDYVSGVPIDQKLYMQGVKPNTIIIDKIDVKLVSNKVIEYLYTNYSLSGKLDELARDRLAKAIRGCMTALEKEGKANINLSYLAANENGPIHFDVDIRYIGDYPSRYKNAEVEALINKYYPNYTKNMLDSSVYNMGKALGREKDELNRTQNNYNYNKRIVDHEEKKGKSAKFVAIILALIVGAIIFSSMNIGLSGVLGIICIIVFFIGLFA